MVKENRCKFSHNAEECGLTFCQTGRMTECPYSRTLKEPNCTEIQKIRSELKVVAEINIKIKLLEQERDGILDPQVKTYGQKKINDIWFGR